METSRVATTTASSVSSPYAVFTTQSEPIE